MSRIYKFGTDDTRFFSILFLYSIEESTDSDIFLKWRLWMQATNFFSINKKKFVFFSVFLCLCEMGVMSKLNENGRRAMCEMCNFDD